MLLLTFFCSVPSWCGVSCLVYISYDLYVSYIYTATGAAALLGVRCSTALVDAAQSVQPRHLASCPCVCTTRACARSTYIYICTHTYKYIPLPLRVPALSPCVCRSQELRSTRYSSIYHLPLTYCCCTAAVPIYVLDHIYIQMKNTAAAAVERECHPMHPPAAWHVCYPTSSRPCPQSHLQKGS